MVKDATGISEADKERAEWLKDPFSSCHVSEKLSYDEFLGHLAAGEFPIEDDDGLYLLRTFKREIIPVNEVYIPHDLRRLMRKYEFTVSHDRVFEQVMQECAAPRGNGNHHWLRDNYKEFLREAHQKGIAHSIEIWRGDNLVGGSLGLQTGAVYISLSIFSRHSSAGSAAFIETHSRISHGDFLMHDAILPSNISRFFHGRGMPVLRSWMLRDFAVGHTVPFPTVPMLLPEKTLDQPGATRPGDKKPGLFNPGPDMA